MRRAEQLPIEAPWTARQPFRGARESLAWCEAQLELLRAYGDAQGMLDAKGQTRPAVDLMHRLEGRVSTLRGELGLTPQALAKLLGQLAGVAAAGGDEEALTALKTEGARILAARAVGPSGDGADAA
jgi:hypothetical protein